MPPQPRFQGGLLVGGSADKAVVPGEPFAFHWQLSYFPSNFQASRQLVLDQVYAELYYNDIRIFGPTPKVPFVMQKSSGDSGNQAAGPVVVQDAAIRKALYQIGTQTLELRIFGTGQDQDKSPFIALFDLEVVPERIDYPWGEISLSKDGINFLQTHTIDLDWNRAADILGTIFNRSQWARMGCAVHLRLTEMGGAPADGAIDVVALLAQGDGKGLRYNNRKFYWLWFAPLTFALFGPFTKVFDLRMVCAWKDEFGNQYPEVALWALFISIKVQTWKIELALASATTAALGVVLISSGFWPAMAAGTVLLAAAGALALGALDPPAPDHRYREAVRLPAAKAVRRIGDPRMVPFAKLAELLKRIAALDKAMNRIHARLLGARIDGNRRGIHLQSRTYREALRELKAALSEMRGIASQAVRAVESDKQFSASRSRRMLAAWKRRGIPDSVRRQLLKAHLSRMDVAQLGQLIRSGKLDPYLKLGAASLTSQLTSHVARFVGQVRSQAPSVLRPKREGAPKRNLPMISARGGQVAKTLIK